MNITQHPSPNHSSRKGKRVSLIVMHWMAGMIAAADATFKNASHQTSAHYGISGGEVHQYVAESEAAWHAGNLDVNQRSIGIEHEGGPNLPISAATMETSAQLVAQIASRYGLGTLVVGQNVKPHRSIVATQCPGTLDIDAIVARANQLNGAGAPAAPAASGGIAEDGLWGSDTTGLLQTRMGTPADRVISHQWAPNRGIVSAATSGWEWDRTGAGSQAIAALQRRLGVDPDGLIGRDTINALEGRAGFAPDGRLDNPSNTVRWLQHALNTNTI